MQLNPQSMCQCQQASEKSPDVTICTFSALSFSLGAMAAQPGTDNLFEAELLICTES